MDYENVQFFPRYMDPIHIEYFDFSRILFFHLIICDVSKHQWLVNQIDVSDNNIPRFIFC